jgi:cytoskeletal protein RodZ
MPLGPQLDEQRNYSGAADGAANQPDLFSKLMPILFGLIAGMLIMLLVVYFAPHEHKQSEAQSVDSSSDAATASNAEASAPSAEASLGANSASAPSSESMGQIQVTSTTTSGYPVITSGAPRAVDYSGRQDLGESNNQPNSVSEGEASTNPCVDPPSVKGPNIRYVDR